tara:strand:+ start:747 stop:1754 length:1008 start_codon:yes stop_codon:yes gene_type:complete
MAYIGKSPQVGNYIKLDAITTSSTNTYNLLNGGVAFVPESALHMLVSLNGVIQAPLTAYSVSGSTITFLPSSGTLSSSDTIDFILVLGNTLDIGTPSDSTVTNAKTNFVSTSSSAGLSIKGDGTTDGTLQLNCSQNSHGVKLASPAHSAGQSYTLTLPTGNLTAGNVLKINSISGSGTTAIGQLEAPSELTLPNQPAIQASVGSNQLNITAGSLYTIPFGTEIFDQGSDYDNSSYTFTAPVTGKYFINAQATIGGASEDSDYYQYAVVTSNRTYNTTVDPDLVQSPPVYNTFAFSVLADMDASDTCIVKFLVEGGVSESTLDFYAQTYLSIFLVC